MGSESIIKAYWVPVSSRGRSAVAFQLRSENRVTGPTSDVEDEESLCTASGRNDACTNGPQGELELELVRN